MVGWFLLVPCEYRNLGTSFADIALLGDLRTQYVNSTAERPYSAPAVLCIFGPPAERRQPVLFNYSRRGTYPVSVRAVRLWPLTPSTIITSLLDAARTPLAGAGRYAARA